MVLALYLSCISPAHFNLTTALLTAMTHSVLSAESVLAHEHRPALILDVHGTVVAANAGSYRMITPWQLVATENEPDPLLQKNVADLGLAPLPGDPPVLWTWSELLRAALETSPSRTSRRHSENCNQATPINVTDEFWTKESKKQCIVETDVYVIRQKLNAKFHGTIQHPRLASMVKARATICWLSEGRTGRFLLTFNRTSLPRPPVPTPAAVLAEPISHFFSDSETPQLVSYFSNVNTQGSSSSAEQQTSLSTGPVTHHQSSGPSSSEIASSIMPFILATLNGDGQVINLSKSWYSFSGLDEQGSLGSGWLASM